MSQTMMDKIPSLSDADLASLLINAQRLSGGGSTKQQSAANELIPALEAETTARRSAKLAAMAERKAARPKRVKAAKAAKAAESEDEAA